MSEKPPDAPENTIATPTNEYKYNFYVVNAIKETIYLKVSSGEVIDNNKKTTSVTMIFAGFNKEQLENHETPLECFTVEHASHLGFRAKNPIPRFILIGDAPEHLAISIIPCEDLDRNILIMVLTSEPKTIDLSGSN